MIEAIGFVVGFVSVLLWAANPVVSWVSRMLDLVDRQPEPELRPVSQRMVEAWPDRPREPRVRVTYETTEGSPW